MAAGAITSSNIFSGGTGYVVNDTGEIAQSGNLSAHYLVLSVDGGGAVLTYTLTDTGSGYSTEVETATQPDGGAGSGFTINILAVSTNGGGGSGYINRLM